MKLIHIGQEPKIGEDVFFQFNKWSDKQAFLLNKDGKIWLEFEMSSNERLVVLQELMNKWLE